MNRIILVLTVFIATTAYSQRVITARINDEVTGKPVKDAKIGLKGKETSTVSNHLGFFQLQVDSTDVLLIDSPQHELLTFAVPKANNFQVRLKKRPLSIYKSGMDQLYEHMARTIKYPLNARRRGEEGYTYVSFRIDSIGKPENLKIVFVGCTDCGDEVIRVLKNTPQEFIDEGDDTEYIMPVGFQLDDGRIYPKKPSELPAGTLLTEFVVRGMGSQRR